MLNNKVNPEKYRAFGQSKMYPLLHLGVPLGEHRPPFEKQWVSMPITNKKDQKTVESISKKSQKTVLKNVTKEVTKTHRKVKL